MCSLVGDNLAEVGAAAEEINFRFRPPDGASITWDSGNSVSVYLSIERNVESFKIGKFIKMELNSKKKIIEVV